MVAYSVRELQYWGYTDAEELTGGRGILVELITELLAKYVLGSMGLAR